jgi:hypothetical protein
MYDPVSATGLTRKLWMLFHAPSLLYRNFDPPPANDYAASTYDGTFDFCRDVILSLNHPSNFNQFLLLFVYRKYYFSDTNQLFYLFIPVCT